MGSRIINRQPQEFLKRKLEELQQQLEREREANRLMRESHAPNRMVSANFQNLLNPLEDSPFKINEETAFKLKQAENEIQERNEEIERLKMDNRILEEKAKMHEGEKEPAEEMHMLIEENTVLKANVETLKVLKSELEQELETHKKSQLFSPSVVSGFSSIQGNPIQTVLLGIELEKMSHVVADLLKEIEGLEIQLEQAENSKRQVEAPKQAENLGPIIANVLLGAELDRISRLFLELSQENEELSYRLALERKETGKKVSPEKEQDFLLQVFLLAVEHDRVCMLFTEKIHENLELQKALIETERRLSWEFKTPSKAKRETETNDYRRVLHANQEMKIEMDKNQEEITRLQQKLAKIQKEFKNKEEAMRKEKEMFVKSQEENRKELENLKKSFDSLKILSAFHENKADDPNSQLLVSELKSELFEKCARLEEAELRCEKLEQKNKDLMEMQKRMEQETQNRRKQGMGRENMENLSDLVALKSENQVQKMLSEDLIKKINKFVKEKEENDQKYFEMLRELTQTQEELESLKKQAKSKGYPVSLADYQVFKLEIG